MSFRWFWFATTLLAITYGREVASWTHLSPSAQLSRRHFLWTGCVATTCPIVVGMPTLSNAVAAPTKTTAALAEKEALAAEGVVSAERVAELLRVVPTFTIVDRQGVPYMVVGEDAKVTGYFFTEFEEAQRILDRARTSADLAIDELKRDQPKDAMGSQLDPSALINPWNEARISTISLDTAVALATRSISATTKNYFQVAASSADIEDALILTGKDDLPENKVPLFYYEDFQIENAAGEKVTPVYFRKSQLEEAYRKANKNNNQKGSQREDKDADPTPPILVTELFATLTEMVRPGGTNQDLKSLVFVPPETSMARAKECQRKGGAEAPFLLGQRNIVL